MKAFKNYNFRQLLNKYVLVFDEHFRKQLKDSKFPIEKDSNAVLTYCYNDHDMGITFAALAAAKYDDQKNLTLSASNPEIHVIFRASDEIEGIEVLKKAPEIDDESIKEKVDIINDGYEVSGGALAAREDKRLDSCRYDLNPDDIRAKLVDPLVSNAELVWVRIADKINEDMYAAMLLNQPFREDYGLNEGDLVFVGIEEVEDEKYDIITFSPELLEEEK